jgi:hypothetical protein
MKNALKLATALAVATLSYNLAHATTPLPNATYYGYVDVYDDGGGIGSPGSLNVTADYLNDYNFYEEGTVTLGATPSPYIKETTFDMEEANLGGNQAQVNITASILYYFEVVGPPGAADLLVTANAIATVPQVFRPDGYGQGGASFGLLIGSVPDPSAVGTVWPEIDASGVIDAGIDPLYDFTDSISNPYQITFIDHLNNHALTVQTNTLYAVVLSLDSSAYEGLVDGGTIGGSAYADPTFTLIGAGAPLDSLVFSPGIGNSSISSVPEPSTWALLIVGFAGLSISGWSGSKRFMGRAA